MLLLLLPLLQWACATTEPIVTSMAPFDETRTLDEYTRKFLLWRDVSEQQRRRSRGVEEIIVTVRKREATASITNNQVNGVDEGDIVKPIGDCVILLRRGRLFAYSISPAASQPSAVSYIDVASSTESADAWYVEILAHDRPVPHRFPGVPL